VRIAADDERQAPQFRPFELLDGGEERVEIEMGDDRYANKCTLDTGRLPGTVRRGTMKALVLAASVLVLAGCAGQQVLLPLQSHEARSCDSGTVRSLDTARVAFAAAARNGAVAYSRPGGAVVARFGAVNVNDYPTVFEALAERVDAHCRPAWYRVQLPIKPNGVTGWVPAKELTLSRVSTRIVVDLSARTLTLYRSGRVLLQTTVAVGSSATPTPIGRYYVNQKLVPADADGPYGPAALGVSAYSTVLTGWVQGGPIGIHGTNEPWSIGRAVSNGCIRLPNAILERVFRLAPAGTPVTISA
jgi:lipoprotein-anchoring transpeptidase ErfK/SrfK